MIAIEGAEMAAGERRPYDAIAIDVHAADAEARQRDLVDFGQCRFRRMT